MSGEGRIVAIVGNTGVGKTTLARLLGRRAPFRPMLEQYEERPFMRLVSQDLKRYALANQVDHLLYRAEQERTIREQGGIGVQDGGLDMDFRVFTRLFFERGYLTDLEMVLCERLHTLLRARMRPPEILVWLIAPRQVVAERFSRRGRAVSIAGLNDIERIDTYLREWLENEQQSRVIRIDLNEDDPTREAVFDDLVRNLLSALRA